jgi:lipoprotein NlpI
VLATADDANADTKRGRVCEANFYSGELALQRDANDNASRLFRLAAAGCPKDFTEFAAANAERGSVSTSRSSNRTCRSGE